MGSKRFRILNRDRKDASGIEVTLLDTTTMPLKELVVRLAALVDTGLWLVPYRGIPERSGRFSFDVALLDQNDSVLKVIAPYPQPYVAPLKGEPASALILPRRSRSALPMQTGNRLHCQAIKEN